MSTTRRLILSSAPLLAVAGCAAIANTASTVATTVGTLAVSTVQEAASFWGTVKGVADVAIAAVSLADPALAASLTAAVSVGDTLLSGLSSTSSDASSLTSGIATLVQHGAALLTQAGANISVVSNGKTN